MKRLIFSILSVFIPLAGAVASSPVAVTGVEITELAVTQQNDSLYISFNATVRGDALRRNESLQLIPMIKDGAADVELPSLLINGRKRAAYYKRERYFQPPAEYSRTEPLAAVTLGRDGASAAYRFAIPVTPAIDGGRLVIDAYIYGCCDGTLATGGDLLAERLSAETPKPERPAFTDFSRVSHLDAPREEVKSRSASLKAYLNFRVDKYDILPDLGNNRAELARIDSALASLLTDRDLYTVQTVTVDGFASPEASWAHNEKLAYNRADNFWKHLARNYRVQHIPASAVKVNSQGEDWTGLVKLVTEGDMPMKDEVLALIERTPDPDQRERRLKTLGDGAPWRYMLEFYFPLLRRMEIACDYNVRSLKDQEAVRLLETRPTDLSLQEMYRACELKGMPRDEAYVFAAGHFPQNPVALLNASSVMLAAGDADAAEAYLFPLREQPMAYNNLGVYYMLRGDYDRALDFLTRAAEAGDQNARANLQELNSYLEELVLWQDDRGSHAYRTL